MAKAWEDRHPALELLAFLLKAQGMLLLIGTIVIAIFAARMQVPTAQAPYRIEFIAIVAFAGLSWAFSSLAAGEVIQVFLEIEENTRRTADAVLEAKLR